MELHTKKPPGAAQKAVLKLELCLCWLSLALAVALWLVTCPGAAAEKSALGKDAEQYLADGNPKAALITLKSAVGRSPQDPAIHAQLARVYLRLDDAGRPRIPPFMHNSQGCISASTMLPRPSARRERCAT
jgi:hypothetical protein